MHYVFNRFTLILDAVIVGRFTALITDPLLILLHGFQKRPNLTSEFFSY